MSAVPKKRLTAEEYLEFERKSEIKHEFYNGRVFAMAGAKRRHNLIALNIGSEIRSHLKGRDCEAYPSDMRVYVNEFGLYTYPDISVVCGEPEFQDDVFDTLLNPVLLIEILSDSTESYDRGRKFQHYRGIESLREYVLVSQNEARVEKYVRQGDGFWVLSEAVGIDSTIMFESIDCPIPLAEIYDKINLEEPDESEIN
ncbi:MAG: Uma2 family endonuclease [Acidobacteria bacterium]|nr:Uma2 family endonuclease [Acidobacteriota bacterium]